MTTVTSSDSKLKGKRDGKLAAKTGAAAQAVSYEESKYELKVTHLGKLSSIWKAKSNNIGSLFCRR